MNSVVSDRAEVGMWSVVAEGCVVRQNQIIQDRTIVVGVPAKEAGKVDEQYIEKYTEYKQLYASLASRFHKSLKKL
jgi:carbonic anhydrase/acetyltransferase-like protein (isoleucine patch superfamily)